MIGSFTATDNRLFVQTLSLRAMRGMLALALVLAATLGLMTLCRTPFKISDPDILMADAILVSQNLNLAAESPSIAHIEKWWQPLGSKLAYRILVIGVLAGTIACIEMLYQHSENNQGIADVSTDGYEKYAWSYIPAVATTMIGLLCVPLDDAIRTLHPFQIMAAGRATAGSMVHGSFGGNSVEAATQAIHRRAWRILLPLFMLLLTSTVTIAVSGLYVQFMFPYSQTATPEAQGWFNLSNTRMPQPHMMQLGI